MSYNTALIVDDSKLARIALKKKLEKRGLQIVMAEGAKEALGVLEQTKVDIVFMDHLMPEMDGFEATAQIKANEATAHLPVIMCSGKEKQGYLEEARAIGASNVLPKPAEAEAIDAVFAQLEEIVKQEAESASAASVVESAPAVAISGEADVKLLLKPVNEQLEAFAITLDAQSEEIEARFAAANDSMQAIGNAMPEPIDAQALKSELMSQLEQGLEAAVRSGQDELKAALREELSASWQEELRAALDGVGVELDRKLAEAAVDNAATESSAPDLDEIKAGIEGKVASRVEASMSQWLVDKTAALEESVQQQVDAMLAESVQEAAPPAEAGEAIDVEALKLSLKEELLSELQGSQVSGESELLIAVGEQEPANDEDSAELQVSDEFAEQRMEAQLQAEPAALRSADVKLLTLLSLVSAATAAAAIALHWF